MGKTIAAFLWLSAFFSAVYLSFAPIISQAPWNLIPLILFGIGILAFVFGSRGRAEQGV
jgi:hypothetical protein